MAKDRDQTLIIVTHDREIAKYGDKVVYVIDGNVERIEINDGDTRRYTHEEHDEIEIKEA